MSIIPLHLIPVKPSIPFVKMHKVGFALSLAAILFSMFLLSTRGLNFGIDFTGGIVIEFRTEQAASLETIRGIVNDLDVGDVSVQTFGQPNDILLRVGIAGNTPEETQATIIAIKNVLTQELGEGIDFRKTDYVGPQVGEELVTSGSLALGLAFLAISLYIWLRFEWQFSAGALLALIHDVIITLGFISFLNLEFDLASVAAILTIIGYSVNDSVVIYDRVRDNLRKFKKMPMSDVVDTSLNETLSRTLLTAGTTAVALVALLVLGGPVLYGFSLAVLFGVAIGTYSSVYIAAPLLLSFKVR